jgi:hypothetical protein
MTADPALLSRADRERLLERLAEADELNRLMREPGGLPSVPEPVPLCRAGRDATKFSKNSSTKFSAEQRNTP